VVELGTRQVGALCFHLVHPEVVPVGEFGVSVIVGRGHGHGDKLPRDTATRPVERIPGDVHFGCGPLQPDRGQPLAVGHGLQEIVVADAQHRSRARPHFRAGRC